MTMKRRKKPCRILPAQPGGELGRLNVEDPDLPGARINAQANVRHDVLVHWRSRKQIDDVQFLAGQKMQALWYRSRVGQPATLRYDRDRVDGGIRADAFSEQVATATAELRQIAAFLGRADYRLMILAICEGRPIEELASTMEGREPQRYIARRVRDALTYLADFWGTVGAPVPQRIHPFHGPGPHMSL